MKGSSLKHQIKKVFQVKVQLIKDHKVRLEN